jgi:omega-hydroxy-beta-dihydromenaquinone-9 sulfotransferase
MAERTLIPSPSRRGKDERAVAGTDVDVATAGVSPTADTQRVAGPAPQPDEREAPVFVIGTGRCGTTALMDLIAYHPGFAWPSQYTARWPGKPWAAALSRVVAGPVFPARMRFVRFVPKHAESYEEWNRRFPGFAQPFRDLVADDVTPIVRGRMRAAVFDIIRYQGATRFITKYTGWSRIRFWKAIFPRARFIHIVRDGRAVAYSYTTMPWWDGWGGMHRSRWAMFDEEQRAQLERYGQSFLALAALQWKGLVGNIAETSASLPHRDVLLIRYEDMVREPSVAARRSVEFARLDPDDRRYRRHLAQAVTRIVDPAKGSGAPPWKRNLTSRQIEMVNELCADELGRFGYA